MPKKTAKSPIQQAHVFYTGRVQGVGFRYTAEALAIELGLVGWVKNLQDGRVELLCQGTKQDVELFLKKILSGSLGPHIKKVDCHWEKPVVEHTDFRVEFIL